VDKLTTMDFEGFEITGEPLGTKIDFITASAALQLPGCRVVHVDCSMGAVDGHLGMLRKPEGQPSVPTFRQNLIYLLADLHVRGDLVGYSLLFTVARTR
jgi:hypothetical protein